MAPPVGWLDCLIHHPKHTYNEVLLLFIGMFGPKGNISDEQVSAGLTFPDVQLQIYEVGYSVLGPGILR